VKSSEELIKQEQHLHKELVEKLYEALSIYYTFCNRYSNVQRRTIFVNIIENISNDVNNHFVTLAAGSDGRISYARNKENRFNTLKKIRMSFARYVRRVLKISSGKLPDADLEAFQEAFKYTIQSKNDLKKQVRILRGDEVTNYYRDTLVKSCMTGVHKVHKIELYSINSDKVGLVVIGNLARALIWKCDDGTIYVDRMYGSMLGRSILQEWTENKGYTYGSKISDTKYYKLTVTLKMDGKTGTPCLDTFFFGRLIKNNDDIVGVAVSPSSNFDHNVKFSDIGLIYA
jgi:hypothetical protein